MPTKPRALSEEAKAAESPVELQQLFFTEEMLELLVRYTNEKIAEDIHQNQYTEDRLKKAPHLKPVGMVIIPYIFMPLSWEVVNIVPRVSEPACFGAASGIFDPELDPDSHH